jgi:hypothetical protein
MAAAAGAAALRPGELSEEEMNRALFAATGARGEYSSLYSWNLNKNYTIGGLPEGRYIIHITGKFSHSSEDWLRNTSLHYSVFFCDNYGCAHGQYSVPSSPGAGHPFVFSHHADPRFPTPLTAAEMEFIKAMPLYDTEFAAKFKGLAARLCEEGGSSKKNMQIAPGAAAGAGGAGPALPPVAGLPVADADAAPNPNINAPAANVNGDPTNPATLQGGRRRSKRTIRRKKQRRS